MTGFAGGSNVTTSATSTVVAQPRLGRRIMISISNYGSNIAWIMFSNEQQAAVGYGIPCYPGQTISDSSSDVYQCWQGSVAVIQDTAGSTTLSIAERVSL